MTSSVNYVAILKGKNAEFRALSQIPDNAFARTMLFCDIPRPTNPDKLETHLIHIAGNINATTRLSAPFYADLYDADPEMRTVGGRIPLIFLLRCFRDSLFRSRAIPVTGLKRGNNVNSELAKEIAIDGNGVCIRLLREDMEVTRFLKGSIAALLDTLSIAPGDCDFLLDFRHLEGSEIINAAEVAVATINNLELWYKSRTLILAASGFPDSFSKIGSFEVACFRRTELDLWQAVCSNPELSRKPIFADYGATPPRTAYLNKEAKRRMSGNIRLTLGDEFRIWKGGLFKTYRSEQYRKLAEMVINDPYVKYRLYGPVLDRLERCAMNMVEPRGPENWTEIGTIQHLVDTSKEMQTRLQFL